MLVDTPVCGAHRAGAAKMLERIVKLYVELNLALAPDGGSGLVEQVTVSRTPPLPVSVARRALQEDIVNLLADNERWYRVARGYARTPLRGREGPRVAGSAAFLGRHLDGVLATSFGVEFVVTLDQLTRHVRRSLGLTKLVHRLPHPCPSCEHKALERDNGSDRVECRYCGRIFTEDEYDRLALLTTTLTKDAA